MEDRYIGINLCDEKSKTLRQLLAGLDLKKDIIKSDTQKYEYLNRGLEWFRKNMEKFSDVELFKDNNEYYRLGVSENGQNFSIQIWDKYNDMFDRRIKNVYSNSETDLDNDDETIIMK